MFGGIIYTQILWPYSSNFRLHFLLCFILFIFLFFIFFFFFLSFLFFFFFYFFLIFFLNILVPIIHLRLNCVRIFKRRQCLCFNLGRVVNSRLSLSRTPRDTLKYIEISVLRHVRFPKLRK